MRVVIPLLAVLLCSSCATSYEPTTMLLENRQVLKGTLVCVMDSVVVLDLLSQCWSDASSKSTLGLCRIPISAIHEVRIPGHDHTQSGAIYGGAGLGALALFGGIVGYQKSTQALIDPGPVGNGIIAFILVAPFGAGAGALVGLVASEQSQIIDPSTPKGSQTLRARTGLVRQSPSMWRHWSYTPPRQRQ